jgi:hypothetical protein
VSGITGIELGPDCCVLVRGGRLGSHRTVAAAALITQANWPAERHALVEQLRAARRQHDLPSRARVVGWGDESSISPLAEAGFEIGTVLTPAQALGRVVRGRQLGAVPGTAVAALSLNTHGGAIAIVAGTQVIHSRVFEWSLGTPFTGVRSELLDRYLLVTQIAPQLKHVIELVRPVYGATVTSVVACGNLPNLRSLSMLLIEELDLEVETLDSDELLDSDEAPRTLVDSITSLQLAAVVASPGVQQLPVHEAPASLHSATDPTASETTARPRPRSYLQSLATVAALVICASWSAAQLAGSSPARPLFPDGVQIAERLEPTQTVPEQTDLKTEATIGRAETEVRQEPPPAASRAAPTSGATGSRQRASSSGPLPSVDGILIAGPRRLAIVGGEVVAAGDWVGVRAVSRIERDGVVLREPSGREIYVAIRPRRPPTLGS